MFMRFLLLILSVIIIGSLAFYLWPREALSPIKPETSKEPGGQTMGALTLKSPTFDHQGSIPSKYTCQGENINPPLEIASVPENTKSLVLIMDDPDAPAGTWVHWLVWNIPQATEGIPQNSAADGIEGTTSFGRPGYGGPCPPTGTHRYIFTLYALDTTLDLPETARKEDLKKAMNGHILDKAELIGLYKKE